MEAWSLGSRDGDRWVWRRDDVTRTVTTYTKDSAIESTRPYTVEENLFADARAVATARGAKLSTARRGLAELVPGIPTLVGLSGRVARLEAIVADLLGDSNG